MVDRVLYLAMNGAKQAMLAQTAHSNNLANVKTDGFKADFEQFRSLPVFGETHPSRVFAATERPGSNFNPRKRIASRFENRPSNALRCCSPRRL